LTEAFFGWRKKERKKKLKSNSPKETSRMPSSPNPDPSSPADLPSDSPLIPPGYAFYPYKENPVRPINPMAGQIIPVTGQDYPVVEEGYSREAYPSPTLYPTPQEINPPPIMLPPSPLPEPPVGHLGLEILPQLDTLIVKREIETPDGVPVFKTENTYEVLNGAGDLVFWVNHPLLGDF
jgi:hypothetical protein